MGPPRRRAYRGINTGVHAPADFPQRQEAIMSGLDSTPRRCGARVRARALGILGIAALAACAARPDVDPAPSPVTRHVVVHNRTGHELMLYLARPGRVSLLGEVGALADASLAVPAQAHPEAANDVWLIAWKLGGPFFKSESFPFPRGLTAEWTIGRPAALTYAALH
jgi:hypothetical protein